MRYKNATLLLWAVLMLTFSSAKSQRDIEPTLIFSDTVNYHFSGEWQYLSSDIYLFNGERFSKLINELDFVRQDKESSGGLFRRKTSLNQEFLEYLFITVRLKNVKFFGDNDVTYPLYNFQISKDKDNKYQTFVSDNIDYVRLIDNLPLYSASDFIDAELKVRAITNNDRDQILGLVASQLKSLSKIQTPTNALLGIIGEFGNFIEANTKKKEYRFSSTIRLFEQKNFDTRLHSVRIYALTTNNSKPILVDLEPIKALLDTSPSPEVSRKLLADLLNYKDYPLIVVANYKSLYRMEQVTGDEVNFANIEKRKLKIENDYKAGLINVETYRQERDFISFITIFANLKNHLEVYSLNYRTGNTEAIAGGLFKLTQYYRQLIKAYDEIQFKYRGNSTYQTVFKKEYESIMGYAGLYLDEDHNLKSVKDLVQTLVNIEKQIPVKTAAQLESTISSLRFSDVFRPHHTEQTIEGQLIRASIEKYEQQLYTQHFEKSIATLDKTVPDKSNRNAPDELRQMLRSTSCGLCRTKGFDAINAYNMRYEEFERQLALMRRDSIVREYQSWIFAQIQKLGIAKENLNTFYPENRNSETRNYLETKLMEADRDIKNLQDFIRIDVGSRDLSMVENLNKKLIDTKLQAERAIELVCSLKPELCIEAAKQQPEQQSSTPRIDLSSSYKAPDPVVRQTNIFIAIFEFQLSSILSKTNQSDKALNERIKAADSILRQLKVANDLYLESLTEPLKARRIESEINSLVKELSDILTQLEGNT